MSKITAFLITVMLLAHFFLVVYCIEANTPTCDEIAHHVASGYSYLVTKDFRMNPANPPLIREMSAVPLLFLDLKSPVGLQSWNEVNSPVFGKQFFYELNKNADEIIFWARIPIALLSVALGFLIFLWSSSLYGQKGGILSLGLFSFSPNIIAHAGLATVDLGATLFMFASIFSFWRFLKEQSIKNLILTGILFGLALASKYTSIFLVPVFILVIIKRMPFTNAARSLFAIFLIGIMTLSAAYFFEVKPVIKNAPDIQEKIEYIRAFAKKINLEKIGLNRDSLVWIAQNIPVPLSAYLIGMGGVIHQSSIGGYHTFLLGKVCNSGFWDYYIVAFLVKSTIPTLMLLICAGVFLFRMGKKKIADTLFLIVPIIVFFAVVLVNKAQVGIRHLLPVYPFIFVLIGSLAEAPIKNKLKYGVFIMAVIWQFMSLMASFPYPIAYFNEIAGGPDNGYKILRDSNLDWGQGLKALKTYMENNGIGSVKLNYFGTADPSYYKICSEPMEERDFRIPGKGVYAISAQYLDSVEWTGRFKPVAKVAHSIFIYKF